uniref:A-kinase anchor protein 8-like n=1 Tax=Sinocyclocheilus rhinocerous TaxID=307959 RepID=A0A673J5I9_9TELE
TCSRLVSGFSGWGGSGGGGSSRGSGGYDLYGYKDSMSSSGGFGGGGYGSSDRMKRGLSGGSLLSSSGSNADDVIAKINQRLDMLTQLEGGMKSGISFACVLSWQQVKAQRDGQKKRKQTLSAADEPESKMGKTDTAGDTTATDAAAGEQTQESEEAAATAGVRSHSFVMSPSNQDESAQAKGKKTPPAAAKVRKRRGFFERSGVKVMTFACSVCKFRSFYSEDMAVHLESKFHKDHFKFLSNQLSKPTTDFLQEYLNNKYKKTEQRVSQMDNHSTVICQVFKEQDLTRDLGMEHFMKKVEAAHCSACDVFIPMQHTLIQKHLKSPDHNYNRKGMMEQSKRSSLSVARSILNHKVIGKKLESYLKGENPFNGNQDDQDPEDSMGMEVSEADLTNESLNEIKQEEEGPLAEGAEPVAEAVGNGEGHEEDAKMEAEEGVEEGVEVGEEEAAEHGVDAGDADAVLAE